ncbi:hypothetical protein Taro_038434 [Colocasia esculenta]|uniref:Protein ARV n=1 Tax=Colocasia esculenta TaxID=4460 RepID=A0A843WCT7_COLES|nr:hypothetical protein [Colocasia esculenta]
MMGLRCVNCGAMVSKLLVQYSPGNIRLMKCESCKAVADPYVECEIMILFIDLVLHKRKAYRHLLFNMLNQEHVNMEVPFTSCSNFSFVKGLFFCNKKPGRGMILSQAEGKKTSFGKTNSPTICPCFASCSYLNMLLQVSFGNFIFFGFIFLSIRFLLNNQNSSIDIIRFKGIMLAILLSSYFKIFLIAMMVWEFPSSVALIIDVFVISSNAVAFKGFSLSHLTEPMFLMLAMLADCSYFPFTVLTQLPTASCIGVLLGAHGTKFLVSTWLQILLST